MPKMLETGGKNKEIRENLQTLTPGDPTGREIS
jgi:hypothetical protein